jgi:hypothetical protein
VNRFLVNFHMKNATMPMTATPPATDIPMIEPVLRLELLLLELLEGLDAGAAEATELDDAPPDSICVEVCVPTIGVVLKLLVAAAVDAVVDVAAAAVVGGVEVVKGVVVVAAVGWF